LGDSLNQKLVALKKKGLIFISPIHIHKRVSAKPRIVVSSCLAGENVRYDGKPVEDEFSERLIKHVEVIRVCPEVGIGLGVPREKIIVYFQNGEPRVSQPSTGLELTDKIKEFSKSFLDSLSEVDGFLLKAKSPSCGVSRTKTYRDREGRSYRGLGKGLFALEVLKRFPHLPVEDEIRLRNERRRLLFLLNIFSLAELRNSLPENSHREVRVVIRTFSPKLERKMREAKDREVYKELLLRAIEKLPIGAVRELSERIVPEDLL